MPDLLNRNSPQDIMLEELEALPDKGGIISMSVAPGNLITAQKELIETFRRYEIPGLYICLDRPWSTTAFLLKRANCAFDHVNFLDGILPSGGDFRRFVETIPSRVSVLKYPYNMTELLKTAYARLNDITNTISPFVKDTEDLSFLPNSALTSDTVFMMVDNLSALEKVTDPKTIVRFVRFLRSILERMPAAYGIVLQTNGKGRGGLIKGIEGECTNNIKIKDWL